MSPLLNVEEPWDAIADTVDFTMPIALAEFQQRVPRSSRILDYGCGYGRVSAVLLANGYRNLQGYDVSTRMVARGTRLNPGLRLAVCSHGSLPEESGSFDAAVSYALLTSIPQEVERQHVVQELFRLLKPTGIVHVAEFLRAPKTIYSADGVCESRNGIAMKHFTGGEIEGLFSGFEPLAAVHIEVKSLSGSPMPAIHYFGRKPA